MKEPKEQIQALAEEAEALREILDHAYECLVVVDRDGYITLMNEVGWPQRIKGVDRIVQRIPVVRGGQAVGAVGKFMFKDMEELREQELKEIRGARYTFDQIAGRSRILQATD